MNTTPKSNRLEYLDEMFRDERLGKLIDDIVAQLEARTGDETDLSAMTAPEEEPNRKARPVSFDEFGQEEVNELDYARACGYEVDDDGHWVPLNIARRL